MSAPGSQFNIGSDSVLTVLVSGSPIGAMLLTKFEFKQLTTRQTSQPVNGKPNFREVEGGWEGTLDYDRSTSALDDFFVAKEAARYAGQQPPQITITTTINNTDGSTSKYRFNGVAMKMDSGGTYSADDKVVQTASWVASDREAA